jgi:hypothetical protein
VNAEELIGWHVNNGKDRKADFFSVSRFRNVYYRPDVIEKVFEIKDESEAIRIANEASGRIKQEASVSKILPPIVNIVSPKDGVEVSTKEVTVGFILRSPSGEPVTGLRVLIDGRPTPTQRGVSLIPKGEDIRQIKVTIPEKDSEISLFAENRYSVSEPSTIRLKWKGEREFTIMPRLYVLSVGISKYKDKELILQYASKDAKDFSETMVKQKGLLYGNVAVKLLTDENATKDEILDGLEWITRETTSKDIAMVFFAGHGVNDPNGIYYFLPVNADTDRLKRTGVAFSDIKNTIASLAGKTVLFVDTCHSGNVMGSRRAVADINAVVNELASAENGAVVFSSSTGKQYSIEHPEWKNGAFTKALVEGINGGADLMGKGKITVNMLDSYISERVKELSKGRQTPTTTKPSTVPDFPIAMRR